MAIAYTKTATTLSLVVGFVPHTIPSSHPNYAQLVKLVGNPKTTEDQVKPLLDIPKAISTFTGGNVTVINGRLYYRGFEVKNTLATVILNFVKSGDGEAAKPFERFLEKAYANPDPRAVEGLYDWVIAGGMPITPEGDILAWKAVGDDYMSIRSGPRGKLRHKIGDVVSEPRHETNANPDQTCSRGIHFCSISYLKNYASGGHRVMAVTISPTNVVAFPKDYNLSKGRCCELTVVGEVPYDQAAQYYPVQKPVYAGWSAPVAKPPFTRFPIKVGDVWKRRDGSTATVSGISSGNSIHGSVADVEGSSSVWAKNGQSNAGFESTGDLVELLKEANPTPRNGSGFAVGQVWADRDGVKRTIKAINGGGFYPLSDTNGNWYTALGRFNTDRSSSRSDLVKLVTDVA